jgi:CubicO group peptidase (beta-lactamase class C family)
MKSIAIAVLALSLGSIAHAAPDEKRLGKDLGYPAGKAAPGPGNWHYDESVRVGSFTHQADIPGLFNGTTNVLQPSDKPMPLAVAAREPDYRWDLDQARGLTVDDYLARQRIMGLLIVKDGVVQVERYQYDRTPSDRFTSQSMAKSITALAIGIAHQEGKIGV